MEKKIYSIEVINLYNEESETPMHLTKVYTDEEEAVADAKRYLDDNANTMEVLEASVFVSETDGDNSIFGNGEPIPFWVGTNTSKPASMRARKEMGYVVCTLDYYAAQTL